MPIDTKICTFPRTIKFKKNSLFFIVGFFFLQFHRQHFIFSYTFVMRHTLSFSDSSSLKNMDFSLILIQMRSKIRTFFIKAKNICIRLSNFFIKKTFQWLVHKILINCRLKINKREFVCTSPPEF